LAVDVSGGDFFSMDVDGSDFSHLRGLSSEEPGPHGLQDDLIVAGGRLFGTSVNGGVHNEGTIYSMNLDGSDLVLHVEFDGRCAPTIAAWGLE
jgi:uncharacterized repeat protein (TIGR03803 family)